MLWSWVGFRTGCRGEYKGAIERAVGMIARGL